MKSFRHLTANINGVIDSVEINRYLYRNINGRHICRQDMGRQCGGSGTKY